MDDLHPGATLPNGISQRTIADRIGVSVSTVSRVLSGHEAVSERTRSDVYRAIEELRGDSAPVPPRLATGKVIGLTNSHLTGGAYRSINDTMVQEILGGAEIAARERGYLVYTLHSSSLLIEPDSDPFFAAVRGVVMTGGIISPQIVEAIRRHNLPIALVGGHMPGLPIPSVSGDAFHGVHLAVHHLAALGHRRIALVNGPSETYTSVERRGGYLTGLLEAGLPIDPALIRWTDGYDGFSASAGQQSTVALLDLPEPPTAIVFANDALAVGGQGICQQRGLRVPQDISIMGYDDNPLATATTPHLTTLRVDRVAWGARAIHRLIDTLEGQQQEAERLLMPVDLILRDSTGPAPNPAAG
ncbi:MAG: LacI family DNA-binding transcriptional regulator [Thermomicrobiales bacterium]